MPLRSLRARAVACLGAIACLFGLFFVAVRPWYLSWGASAEERHRPLPGDEIVPHAAPGETRAITIHAPASRVWPWLAQIGHDRGGFYSYDLLEDLVTALLLAAWGRPRVVLLDHPRLPRVVHP